ncbi:MAG: DUF4163 domain-containing protein [Flavobacteriaceae bacterium]
MRLFFTNLILLLLLIGCKQSDKLTFEALNLSQNNCDQCPKITINLPKANKNLKIGEAINTALKEEIIAQLTFEEENEILEIQDAIRSFNSAYKNVNEMGDGELAAWEARIDAAITYEDPRMITIKMESYLFTGGAHGYGTSRFLNFNKQKGSEIEDWELFNDRNDFLRFAEHRFREQENIPEGEPINSTGYMFERGAFYLPENIGFTEKGIKLLYNEYEVASYADGPIEMTLPYKEVEKYLSGEIKS